MNTEKNTPSKASATPVKHQGANQINKGANLVMSKTSVGAVPDKFEPKAYVPAWKKNNRGNGKNGSRSYKKPLQNQDAAIVTYKNNDRDKLKIIPLGGLQEIGKNMTAIEYRDTIVVVDCGLMFPDGEMLGIDLVIPDVTYLVNNIDKVKAIVLTHGHEDHIGALPYVLPQVKVPVYGTKLTLGMVGNKLKEHQGLADTKLIIVRPRDTVTLGDFQVEFIKTNHSIADAVALAIHTPLGTIVHTGDFKIDYEPIDGEIMDIQRFAELGAKGVLVLLSDSTNVEIPGTTMSESTVGATFTEIFRSAKQRILVATFASHVHRLQQIINASVTFERKVAISGRSMVNVIGVAQELGYLDIPENTLIDLNDVDKYPPEKVVIVTTGSQGEPMSALARMANSEHRQINIVPGDTVILSATPVPGNEKMVTRVINNLCKKGANVIYESLADVHVSGHARQDELKLMMTLVKPKFFIPVHGEYRHLQQHAALAIKMKIEKDNIFIADNGHVLEFTKNTGKMAGTVIAGKVLVDGLGVGDVGNIVLRDRKHLSEDGLIIVVVSISKETGTVEAGPDIISRGFVYVRESEDLMGDARKLIRDVLLKCEERQITEWGSIKVQIKDILKDYLWQKTKRNPMILPIIMEI